MWEANPTWGAPKIVAELAMLGIDVAKSTVEKYKPNRTGPPSPTWRTFLDQHVAIAGALSWGRRSRDRQRLDRKVAFNVAVLATS
jgi:hypothetical protein